MFTLPALPRLTGLVLLLLLTLGLSVPASAQVEPCTASTTGDGSRVALVIGNQSYADAKWDRLPNATNDARAVCEALAKAGFRTRLVTDAKAQVIRDALSRFGEDAAAADTALVYYSGHGFDFRGTGYLVPTDAPAATSRGQLPSAFIQLDDLAIAAARAKSHQFVFIDACRVPEPVVKLTDAAGPNAAGELSQISRPIAPDFGWRGILLYSTSRNRYAYDEAPKGSAKSPFAKSITQRMVQPGQNLGSFLFAVGIDVKDETVNMPYGMQLPDLNGIPNPEFQFVAREDRPVMTLNQINTLRQPPDGVSPAPWIAPPPFAGLTEAQLALVDEPTLIARLLRTYKVSDIEAAAANRDPVAQYMLGYMLHLGDNQPKNLTLAKDWLEQSARSDHPAGLTELAYFLQENAAAGEAGAADRARALSLYERAVAKNFAKAQSHLAFALETGSLGPKDHARASTLFEAAARAGHPYAAFALGVYAKNATQGDSLLAAMAGKGVLEADYWRCELAFYGNRAAAVRDACRRAAEAGMVEKGYAGADAIYAEIMGQGASDPKAKADAEFLARKALARPGLPDFARTRLRSLLMGLGVKP